MHPHPVPPPPPPPQPNDRLGLSQPNDLARAQLEDWLSKALLEIDELKAERDALADALQQQSPRGHVRRTSDLFSPPAPQAPEPQDSPPQDSPRPSPISTSVSFAPDPDFYDDDPDDDPDTSLAALGRSILASRLSPRAASPRADPPRSPSWPNPGTHRFNQHVVGPGVARSVLGMLRRTAASLEALAAGRQDDGPPAPEPDEGGNNVDLEAEVASFVDAVEGLFRDKCEELENLKELTKFIEANVVEKK
ncbi:hypothetical protein TeGR_g6609 [Tetraparma gracilis]|uniref:Uncharacterized protein n=1 Tax=Tetraparma gracilis TaxID=2962635 RepID=A0ABQ6MYP0_9STRA|nr:hypothetical protein TeGR_g6609 [Tetraparma gracilis]